MRGGANRTRSLVTTCGAVLPDFAADNPLVGSEQYSAYIPDAAWDQPTMPRWDLGWELTCRDPGCTLMSETIVATLGARSSAQDVWPGRSGPLDQLVIVDHDDDGLPAITFMSRGPDYDNASGLAYTQVPVSWTLAARATKLLIAFQLAAQFQGQMDDCDTLSGSVLSGRVEGRAVGCFAHGFPNAAEVPCTAAEIRFTDENLPAWMVMGGRFRARRIPPDSECDAVRAVWQ